ncbi:hypothetical protein D1007_39083 [Hordeum vulgare]|nr:hypothetical protein D1007_39083 [Hordeum vulgare]
MAAAAVASSLEPSTCLRPFLFADSQARPLGVSSFFFLGAVAVFRGVRGLPLREVAVVMSDEAREARPAAASMSLSMASGQGTRADGRVLGKWREMAKALPTNGVQEE